MDGGVAARANLMYLCNFALSPSSLALPMFAKEVLGADENFPSKPVDDHIKSTKGVSSKLQGKRP